MMAGSPACFHVCMQHGGQAWSRANTCEATSSSSPTRPSCAGLHGAQMPSSWQRSMSQKSQTALAWSSCAISSSRKKSPTSFIVAMALGLGLHHGSSLDVRFQFGISRREERTCLKNRSRMLSRSPGAGI